MALERTNASRLSLLDSSGIDYIAIILESEKEEIKKSPGVVYKTLLRKFTGDSGGSGILKDYFTVQRAQEHVHEQIGLWKGGFITFDHWNDVHSDHFVAEFKTRLGWTGTPPPTNDEIRVLWYSEILKNMLFPKPHMHMQQPHMHMQQPQLPQYMQQQIDMRVQHLENLEKEMRQKTEDLHRQMVEAFDRQVKEQVESLVKTERERIRNEQQLVLRANESYKLDNTTLQTQIDACIKRVKELESENKDLGVTWGRIEGERQDLKRQKKEIEVRTREFELQMVQLTQEREGHVREHERLVREHEQLAREHEQRTKTITSDNERLVQELKSKEEELKTCKIKNRNLLQENGDLSRKLDVREEDAKTCQVQKAELEQKIKNSEEAHSKSRTTNQRLSSILKERGEHIKQIIPMIQRDQWSPQINVVLSMMRNLSHQDRARYAPMTQRLCYWVNLSREHLPDTTEARELIQLCPSTMLPVQPAQSSSASNWFGLSSWFSRS
jgi:hypothetical protein